MPAAISPAANYVGRFAPSPSGPLHFGSLVAALASYLDAKAHGGQWLVRIEDVDETRCKPQYADDILRTLQGFGLRWDGEVIYQRLRKARYEQALTDLTLRGLTYACICSRREIADSAVSGLEGPVYPGTCRHAHHPMDAHAMRVITNDAQLGFTDRVQGAVEQRLQSALGDFIIRRRDQLFSYQLAVVVDDADQGITHVVRGADLIDSTPRQIHLQQLLALPTPQYLHIPVVTNSAGQKLSKQTLAHGLTQGEALMLLRRALRFLGQPLHADAEKQAPAAMLSAAASAWSASAIPNVRVRPMPH